MKEDKLFDLQLFAEGEGGEGGDGDNGNGKGGNGEGQNKDPGKGGDGNKPAGDSLKYTDKDVDDIISKKFAKWQAEKEKEINEAKKLEQMNAQEKAEHERDKIQAELDALKKANTKAELISAARKMLSGDGVNVADDLLTNIIGEDADTTKTNVEAFKTAYTAAIDEGVKAALKGKTPGAGSSSTITKDEIMKVSDAKERQKLIKEHINLFQN